MLRRGWQLPEVGPDCWDVVEAARFPPTQLPFGTGERLPHRRQSDRPECIRAERPRATTLQLLEARPEDPDALTPFPAAAPQLPWQPLHTWQAGARWD